MTVLMVLVVVDGEREMVVRMEKKARIGGSIRVFLNQEKREKMRVKGGGIRCHAGRTLSLIHI